MKKSLYLLLFALLVIAMTVAITGCNPDENDEGGNSGGDCGHIFNEELDYSHDDEAHWYACTLGCGAKYKVEKHVWSTVDETNITKQPSCEEEGHATLKCTVCNKEKIELLPKTKHNVGTAFSSNETHHWQMCGGCETEMNKEAHNFKIANYDKEQHWLECKCGTAGTKANHSWVDVNENTQKCSDENCEATQTVTETGHTCTYDNGSVTQEATCSTPGIITYTCTVADCGATYTVSIKTIPHVYNGAWDHDDTHHWRNCKCGEKAPESERELHDYSDKPTTDGYDKVYECECGIFKIEDSTGYMDPDGWT